MDNNMNAIFTVKVYQRYYFLDRNYFFLGDNPSYGISSDNISLGKLQELCKTKLDYKLSKGDKIKLNCDLSNFYDEHIRYYTEDFKASLEYPVENNIVEVEDCYINENGITTYIIKNKYIIKNNESTKSYEKAVEDTKIIKPQVCTMIDNKKEDTTEEVTNKKCSMVDKIKAFFYE